MPSRRVTEPSISVRLFDVIGADSDQDGFICHVGLARPQGEYERSSVSVMDMAPPMRATGQMKSDVLGTADLTEDEVRRIKDFVDRHEGEHAAIQMLGPKSFPKVYCLVPHACPFFEEDGRYARMRFSCAGFVFEAYKRARIVLFEEQQMPPITIGKIKEAYHREARLLEVQATRESLGLAGDGPWPLMLCGYIFHSLGRDPGVVRGTPYVIRAGDERF